MNVLLTTDSFPPGGGGSGKSTAALASALSRRGHRVRVVVSRREPCGQKEWEGVEVDEVLIPASRPGNARERERAFASGIVLAAGEEAWDLAHAQHWLSAGATRRALPRLPTVVTVRDYWPVCIWSTMLSGAEPCPGCSYRRRVVCIGRHRPALWPISAVLPPLVGWELETRRRVLEGASAVTAVSRYVARTLPVERVTVIPNFVEPRREEPARPTDVPERYLLFVGKLEPGKAPDRLLPILAAARAGDTASRRGLGSSRSEPPRARRRRPLSRLGGRGAGARAHQARGLPPLSLRGGRSRSRESFSMPRLSASVIVAEPTGGTEEIVVDGESGLLGRSVEELGRAVRRVLDDPSLVPATS